MNKTTIIERPRADLRSPAADFRISRDAAAFHAIFHDPSVLPFVIEAGKESADLTALVENEANIGFLYDGAAFLAHCLEPCVYEVHSAALPIVRGRYVAEAATLAIRFMFCATPAQELLTRVVDGNLAATALTAKMGFVHDFDRADAWQTAEGPRDVRFYAMRYPDWIRRQDWLQATGEWFHSLLGDDVSHGPDPEHDRRVGAAVEMVLGGQPEKGVALYNRWARFAGYAPISIVGFDPVSINIVSHVVTLVGDKLEVVQCQ